ncbi:cell division protein FtsA [Parabacteroides provencensis]|uniref:cell division protein FtsA n=1 Tax=Parabacteroides provencensis TaxID=1944636 RepID=UPI000C14636B|nr:cell division protein FtsA [Parabacteroides provencensis]
MAYTDFIATIDLGTSQMVGMVGTKNAAGTLSIIAYEVENSANCIRRGCVYNVEETANKIKRLILKLENKLGDAKIGKVYVGIGGQSIRSLEHAVPKVLPEDGEVTEEMLDALYQECKNYHPEMLDVLAITSPTYFLDDKPEANPKGIPCKRIDAHYQLIVGRPSLKRHIMNSISERAKVEIADIVVSPLALADVILTEDEKMLGCALINFGAGVTSLSVYKNGNLVNLSVIPFGGNLITKDIMSLHLVEAEAERVKLTYGSAMTDKDNDQMISINSADGMGLREIKLSELNNVVEARIKEILENIYARIEDTGLLGSLAAGVIVTGGAAALKNLQEVISSRLQMDVRYTSVRKGLVEGGEMIASNPGYATAVGLLMQGTKNCAAYIPPKPEPVPEVKPEPESFVEEVKAKPEEKKVKKVKKPSIFDRLKKNIDNMTGDLFDDEER